MYLPLQAAGRRYLRFFRNGMINTSEVVNSKMFETREKSGSGGTYTFTCTLSQSQTINYHCCIYLQILRKDLKSFSRQRECGFKSRPGHQ